GVVAFESGSAAEAEKDWNQLLELAIIRPRAQSAKRSTTDPAAPAASGAPPAGGQAAANKAAAPPRVLDVPPVTLSQFQIRAALAQLAAQHEMPALSLRAVREVVAGGLPVADLSPQMTATRQQVAVRTRGGGVSVRNDADQQIYDELATRMWQVSTVWQKKN